MNNFNVIRLDRGPKKGQVHIIPCCRQGGYRMRNGHLCSRPLLRAQALLCNVSYDAAYWYAVGLLTGMGESARTPYIKVGRSKVWKGMRDEDHYDDEPYMGRGRGDREDFHSDG